MYLYGAGGHAKVVIDILMENNIPLEGIYDDNQISDYFNQYNLVHDMQILQDQAWLISIGNNVCRKKISSLYSALWTSVISQQSYLSRSVSIGSGTVVMKGVSVNADSVIGDHVILNTNSSIDHDCIVEDFVHISPNVALSGGVRVGEGSHLGIGTCVIPGIEIGKWAVVGAGTVVIKNVPDYAVVVGNPGRIVKYNNLLDI
ncbi:acetyltransferase [Bacteroidales bacterium OttesenSCG-928-M06]|nr:acetyltransferase [Bacteroidales bacterium OttesenSCG-928-M06]